MAQEGGTEPRGVMRLLAQNQSVSVVQTGNTVIMELDVRAVEKVNFEVQNTVQALDAFVVETRVHPNGTWRSIASAAGDYSSPAHPLSNVSGALVTLAAGATGYFSLDTSGLAGVRIKASGGNATPSVVSIYASGSGAGTSGGVPVTATSTVADGANVVEGTTTDAAVTAGAAGTISAKLRSISRDIVANIVLAAGSAIIGKVSIDQATANANDVNVKGFNGREYETVAASQTAQALGATGATGDDIDGVLVIPATTSPGNVILLDNATSITIFTGGASSVSNLVPFLIPLGMRSVSGAWKLTTGANVSCIGIGNFT